MVPHAIEVASYRKASNPSRYYSQRFEITNFKAIQLFDRIDLLECKERCWPPTKRTGFGLAGLFSDLSTNRSSMRSSAQKETLPSLARFRIFRIASNAP